MGAFMPAEIAYLDSQMLGRLATTGPKGHPHVVPVGYRYNLEADAIDIGGHRFAVSRKFRDIQRQPWVAFVVDDIASTDPWRVRGVEVRGIAEVHADGGEAIRPGFDPEMVRIRPRRVVSWGLDGSGLRRDARSVDQ